jgi:diguanylate cyclase (GGDEF)-like protein/PAS domain S-box-containing protein
VRAFPQRPLSVLAVCLLAFAAITVARFAVANPAEAVGYLYVLPIALIATRFGRRAGAGAGSIGLLGTATWAATRGVDIGVIGYTVRGVIFVGTGVLIGALVRQRDQVQHEAGRWFEMSNDLVCVATFDGRLARLNGAWHELLGYSHEELLDQPFARLVHPDDLEATAEATASLTTPSALAGFENRYRAKDGTWHWLLWSARSDRRHIYAVAKDITERKLLEREREELIRDLRAAARTDELTALPNRRAWNERFLDEIKRSNRSGEPLSIALLDLDDFKAVNDTRGHAAGDRLLREVAAAWRGTLRETDYLGRLGGDEFAVILPGCGAEEHDVVIDRLRAAMPPNASTSVGVAEWDHEEPLEQLMRRADQALYRAKAPRLPA